MEAFLNKYRGGVIRLFMLCVLVCLVSCGGSVQTVGTEQNDTLVEKSAKEYRVIKMETPNVSEGVNRVEGIVLHHTATASLEESIDKLTTEGSGVSCHVLIDRDGTRYVFADPTAITWHAGRSRLNGREGCNDFTVGIEFQGNTVESPLTEDQIESASQYIKEVMTEYNAPKENIVTHEQIRAEYKKAHPGTDTPDKVDVTTTEYHRVLDAL